MMINKIITLANDTVRLRFLAMERSLRATGCTLPLWVIPYDDQKFELPPHALWYEDAELFDWLAQYRRSGVYRKYLCLLTDNYQFVDSDVVFLRNPAAVLENHTGFITSCGHWRTPNETYTNESLQFLKTKSSLWEKLIFNTGQFACSQPLYSFDTLRALATTSGFIDTCLLFKFHEQPAVNLLVNASTVKVTNLTLRPGVMESTWAGDYNDDFYTQFWTADEQTPYLIHWAGCDMTINRPIDKEFLKYLAPAELSEWSLYVDRMKKLKNSPLKKLRLRASKLKIALRAAMQ
jgi:hypothetical protein